LPPQGSTTGAVLVRVPGGEVSVEVTDASSFLRGPSVLVARGTLSDQWLLAQR
jgi:diaminopimelate epimerase